VDVVENNDDSLDSNNANKATKLNGNVAEASGDKTPGLRAEDSDSDAQSLGGRSLVRKNFWSCYVSAVNTFLTDMKTQIDVSFCSLSIIQLLFSFNRMPRNAHKQRPNFVRQS
jgi:hypothetical protein